MTRTEYLSQLNKYLKRLPAKDYQEAMEYFTEYFDEAGPENEQTVIEELGTPKEAAQEILHNLLDKNINKQDANHKSYFKAIWIGLLVLCASPIAIPIILTLLAILFAVVMTIISLLVAGFVMVVSFILATAVLIWESLTLFQTSWAIALMGIGGAFLLLAFGLFLWLIISGLVKLISRGILASIKWISERRRLS